MNVNKADAILVLGRVNDQGELTKDASERIRYTAELFGRGLAPVIIAPAKWSYKLNFIPKMTEAAMIKEQLVDRGVPEGRILCEEKSCDTLGAAYYLKIDYVLPRHWRGLIVVTSLDHLSRTQYVFDKVFGSSIKIQYVYGEQVLNDFEMIASVDREARSLKLMQTTWLGPIRSGDHKSIAKVLELHPGYNSAAKMSAEEIERLVQSQAL